MQTQSIKTIMCPQLPGSFLEMDTRCDLNFPFDFDI